MLLTLTRRLGDDAHTPGSLLIGAQTYSTIELPWRDDKPDESCVPHGDYELHPYQSPEKGLVYRLHAPALGVYGFGEVPPGGRSAIEIHPGNWARQSLGCILIGWTAGELFDEECGRMMPAVLQSDAAMLYVRRLLGATDTHQLTITGY